jgi:hypothetical protein
MDTNGALDVNITPRLNYLGVHVVTINSKRVGSMHEQVPKICFEVGDTTTN